MTMNRYHHHHIASSAVGRVATTDYSILFHNRRLQLQLCDSMRPKTSDVVSGKVGAREGAPDRATSPDFLLSSSLFSSLLSSSLFSSFLSSLLISLLFLSLFSSSLSTQETPQVLTLSLSFPFLSFPFPSTRDRRGEDRTEGRGQLSFLWTCYDLLLYDIIL